jgi:hypothetical protein
VGGTGVAVGVAVAWDRNSTFAYCHRSRTVSSQLSGRRAGSGVCVAVAVASSLFADVPDAPVPTTAAMLSTAIAPMAPSARTAVERFDGKMRRSTELRDSSAMNLTLVRPIP